MGYRYSAIHNTILHDGNDTDDAVIQDGQRIRGPMTMMDSMQRSIAGSVTKIDDSDVTLISRQEMQDFDKAELGARWKGGLAEGDTFRLGDKLMVVSGRNPENGQVVLRDASTSATDGNALKQNMYDEYDNDIQSRYLNTRDGDAEAGDTCTTPDGKRGTWRDKNGRLVCVTGGKPDEWAIAGPLSDAQRVKIKDEMYADYDAELAERWRR